MTKPALTLYVDIVSPFAYLAFHVVNRSAIFKQCDVTYVPMLLGAVMKATGNSPPLTIKNKGEWINKERLRWARKYDIPIAQETPAGFPINTVQVQRMLCAIQQSHPEKMAAALAEFWQKFWVEGINVSEKAVCEAVLEKVLGEADAKKITESATTPAIKQILQKNTDQSLADSAFGLPWFVATNAKGEKEGFWGFDHLGQVVEHLGLDRGNEFRTML